MGLFTTKTRHTYHQPRQRVGHSTTLTAKTRLKRWTKRKAKSLWRTTKRRIRNRWRRYQRKHPTRKQQTARRAQQLQRQHAKAYARTVHRITSNYQQDSSYQLTPTADGNYQATPTNTTTQATAGRPPPPDGAIATCRRCSNEVQYNAGRERWEHTHHGNWECFQPHRT